jgi:hypothetical protein
VVFCEREGDWTNRIYALEADGHRRFLAGGHGYHAVNGPGATARFVDVHGLALDRRGNVSVLGFLGRIQKISLDGYVSDVGPKAAEQGDLSVQSATCMTVDPATGDLYVGERDRLFKLTPGGKLSLVIGGQGIALAASHGSRLAPLAPGRVPVDTRFHLRLRHLAMHGRELFLVSDRGIDAFHLDTRRLARIVPCDAQLYVNRLGPVPYLNPHLPAERCAALRSCGPLALTKEAMAMAAVGAGLVELELPDDPVTSIMDPPSKDAVPPGAAGETKRTALESDNLWPGQPLETGTVRADGQWGISHWRSAATGQRFSGQCWVEARGLSQGWAQISLLFVDEHGKALGHSHPMGRQMPDVVSAPAHGRTLLRMEGTAPGGTDRVALCIQVVKGNPGAVVTFEDMTFQQLP